MTKPESESTVTQSLVDRLIDKEPQSNSDAYVTRPQSVRQLKANLRRDLEWLLNSRQNPDAVSEGFPDLSRSLYNYGLPDFSALSLNSPKDRNWLLRYLATTVETFEPRLREVRVSLLETPNSTARVLRFQIEALLMMDPAPEQVSFDTVLQLTSGEYQIRGERSA
ncbi:MAG TPA: type VI secretion system baseplate subunit TssE [Bryobacteraceae bacterium]|nr:type VI secretion system baseplate subunit TssE [Bryobacteraceae bacterium]